MSGDRPRSGPPLGSQGMRAPGWLGWRSPPGLDITTMAHSGQMHIPSVRHLVEAIPREGPTGIEVVRNDRQSPALGPVPATAVQQCRWATVVFPVRPEKGLSTVMCRVSGWIRRPTSPIPEEALPSRLARNVTPAKER